MTWTLAEPFAGAASVAIRAVGGAKLANPVAWMGSKRRYARAILDAMGVPEGPPARVLLADAGPWGWVWPLLLSMEGAAGVASFLRAWSSEHPRDLWQRLAAVPPAEDLHERAAQWLWLQARSASGVPIWWDGWRTEDQRWVSTRPQQAGGVRDAKHALDTREDHQAQRAEWMASNGSGQPVAAGQKTLGSWRFDARPGDAPDRPAGQAGQTHDGWRMGEEQKKAKRGTRTLPEKGGNSRSRTGGMVNPGTIAARVEDLARAFACVALTVHHGDARGLDPAPGFAFLDPPYSGSPAVIPPVSAALLLAPDSGNGCELDAALRAASLQRLGKMVRHLRVTLAEVLRTVVAEPEVLDRVVELVVVDVVDDLAWSEWATEVALHDQAVLRDLAVVDADEPVAAAHPPGPLACAAQGRLPLGLRGRLRGALAEFYVAAARPAPVLAQALTRADVLAGEAALQRTHERGAADVALDVECRRHVTLRGLARLDIGNRHRRAGTPKPTGYGWDLPRAEVLALARRWADAGAVVAVSEAEPLDLPGWHHLDLTREGRKREWLTLSRPPARLPARQGSLFSTEAP